MMNRIATYAAGLAVVLALISTAPAQATSPGAEKISRAEHRFLLSAAEDNLVAVQLGRLAKQHAGSEPVKKFAERMATDHQQTYDSLEKLAHARRVALPGAISTRDQREYDRLAKLSGAEFDRAYIERTVRDHDREVKAFERAAKTEKDADVRDWAAKTLATTREHQKTAHDLAAELRTGTSPSASPRGLRDSDRW